MFFFIIIKNFFRQLPKGEPPQYTQMEVWGETVHLAASSRRERPYPTQ